MHSCTSFFFQFQLTCVVWGICTSFSFHALCILHALCCIFHLSSLSSFMGSFAPHCHTSHSCHAFTVSTSAIQLFQFPEASLHPHLFTFCASHMPSVAVFCHSPVLCFSRTSAHPPLFTFHAMRLMCLMPHQLPFIFSPPLGHPSIPIFSHSMH